MTKIENGNGIEDEFYDGVYPLPEGQVVNGVGECQWCHGIMELSDFGVCEVCLNPHKRVKPKKRKKENIKKGKNINKRQRRL